MAKPIETLSPTDEAIFRTATLKSLQGAAEDPDRIGAEYLPGSSGGNGALDAGKVLLFGASGDARASSIQVTNQGGVGIEVSTNNPDDIAYSVHLVSTDQYAFQMDGTGAGAGSCGFHALIDGRVLVAGDSGTSENFSIWGDGSIRWHPAGDSLSATYLKMVCDAATALRTAAIPDVSGKVCILPTYADSTAANAAVSVGDVWWDTTLKKARTRMS